MVNERIPVVQVLGSGREIVVGQGCTMEGAGELLHWLVERHPAREYYIDCARTIEEISRA